MKKLLAFDLDGTILDKDGRLSSLFLYYLDLLSKKDYLVTFITGRNPSSVKNIIGSVDLDCPISCSNGAVLIDAVSGEVLEEKFFSQNTLDDVFAMADEIGIEALEYQLADTYVFPLKSYDWAKEYLPFVLAHAEFVTDDKFYEFSHKSYKFDVFGSSHTINEFHNKARNSSYDFEVVKGSIHTSLEITPAGINKGYGLKRLCEICKIPIKLSTVIGDSYNDVSMFQKAGISYAMGNAPDEVKKEAGIISPYTDLESQRWILNHLLS